MTVVGVHSAKFDNEKDSGAIRNAVLRYDVTHPVTWSFTCPCLDFSAWRRLIPSLWHGSADSDVVMGALVITGGEWWRDDHVEATGCELMANFSSSEPQRQIGCHALRRGTPRGVFTESLDTHSFMKSYRTSMICVHDARCVRWGSGSQAVWILLMVYRIWMIWWRPHLSFTERRSSWTLGRSFRA